MHATIHHQKFRTKTLYFKHCLLIVVSQMAIREIHEYNCKVMLSYYVVVLRCRITLSYYVVMLCCHIMLSYNIDTPNFFLMKEETLFTIQFCK